MAVVFPDQVACAENIVGESRRSCRLASIVPGAKVPALAINRVLYRDGAAIASLIGGEVQWIEQIEPGAARAAAENALIRRPIGSALLAYLR